MFNSHSVGKHFNTIDHRGLDDAKLFVLHFDRKDPDSEESLAIRLVLKLLWIHRLGSTTPKGFNVFYKKKMMPLRAQKFGSFLL